MSWRILLSEYPKSLLSNERAVKLLVLLEWGGALTEEQLQVQLNMEKTLLVDDLLSLHKNKCIEYSSQYIKVSDRGKRLIDSFSLQTEIIDHLIKTTAIPESSKSNLREVVKRYRTRNYDKYLDSSFAIHLWDLACKNSAVSHKITIDDVGIGKSCILFIDLINWAREDPLEQDSFFAARKSGKHSLFHLLGREVIDDGRVLRSSRWIEKATDLENADSRWSIIREDPDPAFMLFATYSLCRTFLGGHEWRDEWCYGGHSHDILNSNDMWNVALLRLSHYGEKNWGNRLLESRQKTLKFSHERFLDEAVRQNLNELVWKLLTANSLAELADKTSLPGPWLEQLLAEICEKCTKLLKEKEGGLKKEETT